MKTNLDKNYKTNSVLENEGVEFSIDGKVIFKVRRFHGGNPRVKAAMAKYHKPYAKQIEMGALSNEKSNELTVKMFVETCLVSWTGLEDENGKPIEYTFDNAVALFISLPAVFDAVWKYANDFETYKEDLGNS